MITHYLGLNQLNADAGFLQYGASMMVGQGFQPKINGTGINMTIHTAATGYDGGQIQCALYTYDGTNFNPVTNGITNSVNLPQGDDEANVVCPFPVAPILSTSENYFLIYALHGGYYYIHNNQGIPSFASLATDQTLDGGPAGTGLLNIPLSLWGNWISFPASICTITSSFPQTLWCEYAGTSLPPVGSSNASKLLVSGRL